MTQPDQAQNVLAPPARSAIFLVAVVRPGAEDVVRDLLTDVAGLVRAVGFRHPEGELSCVVGIGDRLWDRAVRVTASGGAAPVPAARRRGTHRRHDTAICCSTCERAAWTCASNSPAN
ncbi:MAG: Dyp-type peroxidase domain-containing protein [Jatrophihabitantaceae bacterium]